LPARSLPGTGLEKESKNHPLCIIVNTTGIKPMPMQIGRAVVCQARAGLLQSVISRSPGYGGGLRCMRAMPAVNEEEPGGPAVPVGGTACSDALG